jgi:hypothetical protein
MPRDPAFKLPQPIFDEPAFNESQPTPDPTRFQVPHPSDTALYQRLQQLLYEDVVPFPPSRAAPSALYSLAAAWGPHGPEVVQGIETAGRIVFHAVGDIGASTQPTYRGELRVSDAVTADCQTATAGARPSFLYLLGDLIYDFGEAQYYYDEFYDPYRNYPGPIFAIPGNHDSFIVPGTPSSQTPLVTFQRNFCAEEPVVTPEAGSLHRTAMTQPGVYFALDAPFVRILGLFSNALEDPGVISSEAGKWKGVPDYQLEFLSAQLSRARTEGFAGALLLALHHPPFNYAPVAGGSGGGGVHGGNPAMLAEIDAVCEAEGVYPHAVLAGHAHNYQRYTRSFELAGVNYQVPFIVAGGGGHGLTPLVQAHLGSPAQEPADGADVTYLDPKPAVGPTRLLLDRHDDHDFGYLRVTVDAQQISLSFYPVGSDVAPDTPTDTVVVDLAQHTIRAASDASPGPAARKGGPGSPRPSSKGRGARIRA